jgi:hypothetical protein
VSAADAATAAAAIAAKIAASLQPTGGELVLRAPEEGDYVKDIDINDLRNRYVLTRVQTQRQVSGDVGKGGEGEDDAEWEGVRVVGGGCIEDGEGRETGEGWGMR